MLLQPRQLSAVRLMSTSARASRQDIGISIRLPRIWVAGAKAAALGIETEGGSARLVGSLQQGPSRSLQHGLAGLISPFWCSDGIRDTAMAGLLCGCDRVIFDRAPLAVRLLHRLTDSGGAQLLQLANLPGCRDSLARGLHRLAQMSSCLLCSAAIAVYSGRDSGEDVHVVAAGLGREVEHRRLICVFDDGTDTAAQVAGSHDCRAIDLERSTTSFIEDLSHRSTTMASARCRHSPNSGCSLGQRACERATTTVSQLP